VKAKLKLHPVSSLVEMVDYAQRIDIKNLLSNKNHSGTNKSGNVPMSYPSSKVVSWESRNKGSHSKSVRSSSIGACTSMKITGSYQCRIRGYVSDGMKNLGQNLMGRNKD
jgi:hypothetical protein